VFDVDVQGGLNLKKYYGDKALAIYVKAPDMETIEQRLRNRGTETEESVSKRLFKVNFEMSFMDQFDTILINDKLEETLEKAQEIFEEFTV
jgi:guanylate kinase